MLDFLQALRRAKSGKVIVANGGNGARYMYNVRTNLLLTQHGSHQPDLDEIENDWIEE